MNERPIQQNTDVVTRIRSLIRKIPPTSENALDESLSQEFFAISEDVRVPQNLRDFCLDLSLRAKGVEAGPLRSRDKDTLLVELQHRAENRMP